MFPPRDRVSPHRRQRPVAFDERPSRSTINRRSRWVLHRRTQSADGDFVPIDIDADINARIGRMKPPLKVLWARYLHTPPPTPSARHCRYEPFCQIIAEHVRTHDLPSPITHIPGHTMQVDWAGTPMWITDPITRPTTRVSVFVATLPYSGTVSASGCLDEKLSAWCDAHRRAFEYFGGVAQVIIPDNASTASNQISKYDKTRDVNTSDARFLQHYNTAAVPTRAYKPKEKANVESGVKIVTNWIIHYLTDRTSDGFVIHPDSPALGMVEE